MTFRNNVIAALLVLSCAGVAFADHSEPAKGKKATFALVNAHIPCDTPNTDTSAGISACTPAVPPDPCQLSPTGTGKFTVQVVGNPTSGTEDIKLVAVANGLTPTCEAAQLSMTLSFRATSDDCPEGSCTTSDYDGFEIPNAFCFVTNGKCTIKTTLSAADPGLLPNGKNTGITLRGCALRHSLGVPSPLLECGIVLK